MRIYTVHIDPLSAADDRGALFLREGFSWAAAGFSVFWALYHGLWDWALLLFVVGTAVSVAVAYAGLDPMGAVTVEIGFMVLVGAMSNDWRRRVLDRRGYRLDDIVSGENLESAEQRYFSRASQAV